MPKRKRDRSGLTSTAPLLATRAYGLGRSLQTVGSVQNSHANPSALPRPNTRRQASSVMPASRCRSGFVGS
jgi:hypothetical protein